MNNAYLYSYCDLQCGLFVLAELILSSTTVMDGHRKKFLIDTDAGVDDAQAILMALAQPDVDVVAITTTHGNTTAHQVGKNVLRVLKVADRLDVRILSSFRFWKSLFMVTNALCDCRLTSMLQNSFVKFHFCQIPVYRGAEKITDRDSRGFFVLPRKRRSWRCS